MQEKQFFTKTMAFKVTTEKEWKTRKFINEQHGIILCKKYFRLAIMATLNIQHCLVFYNHSNYHINNINHLTDFKWKNEEFHPSHSKLHIRITVQLH